VSGLLVVCSFIAYWWLFWNRVCRTLPFGFMYLVVAAPLVSFALLPIAMDYSRYLAWMAWNMLFLIAITREKYPLHTEKFISSAQRAGTLLFAWRWSTLTGPLNFWDGAPYKVRVLFRLL
jgi:hypothetical protein